MQAHENRLRQRLRHDRYRQRLKARGLAHVQGWVTPEPAEAIRRIVAERSVGTASSEKRHRGVPAGQCESSG